MNGNMRLFYQGALALKLPAVFHPEIQSLEINLGNEHYYFSTATTPFNTGASVFASNNKSMANKLLALYDLPVAKSITFSKQTWREKPLRLLIQDLKFPLVIKPASGSCGGYGVFCNIRNIESLSTYLNDFFDKYSEVQVEEYFSQGRDYRVLILKNKVLGVLRLIGAHVKGDGLHSIEELIKLKNQERKKYPEGLSILPLIYDMEYEYCLKEQGLSLSDIPEKNQYIKLCNTVNTYRGGEIVTPRKKIHPDNAKKLSKAAAALGLEYVGFDLRCEDISQPFKKGSWVIFEANTSPDTTIHEMTPVGKKTPVVKKILRQLIWRHPFSYLDFLLRQKSIAIFFRVAAILCVGIMLIFFLG